MKRSRSIDTTNRFKLGYALVFLLVILIVIVLDQLSKQWIISILPLNHSLPEIGPLTIIHIQNTGAAFGLFQNQQVFLTVMAVAGLIVVLTLFRYIPNLGYLATVAVGLLCGGAIGNLIDRMRTGHVTDFIYVRLFGDVYWPAFNVADSAITIGAISLGIILYVRLKKEDESKSKLSGKNISGS